MSRQTQRKKGFIGPLKNLALFLAPYKKSFFGAVVMMILNIAAITAAPSVEGMVTTQLAADAREILKGTPGAGVDFHTIGRIILVLVVLYLFKTIVQTESILLLTNSIQNAMFDLRGAVQDKISRLPVRYFDRHSSGDLLSRITNDVETVSNALQQTFSQIISGVITILLAVTMMFAINPVMAGIALLIIPLSLLVSVTIVKKSQKHFQQQQDSLGDLNGLITERYTGYNEILLYNRQEDAICDFEQANDKLCRHAFKAQFMSSLMAPLISLCTYLTIGVVAVTGALFVVSGTIKIGQLQAFIRYIWQVNDPVSQVSQLSTQIQSAFAAMQRIFAILNEQEEVPEVEPASVLEDVKGNVSFDRIVFGYGEKPIIRDFSVDVKAGQMVAIVGPTGAGKTTMINLLLRFYDVNGGCIRVDGVDIREMHRRDLRSLFGMVLQDTWLFSGTIYDNIRYGKLDARKDEIVDAARMANVHHFIKTLPHGYDMVMNEEGGNISQGEKQLITLARAILRDPKILILDEATSSVDTRLEKKLQDAMKKVMEGRTSFVIAHRLSTIRNADMILVMRDGRIVEHGTHDELLERRGYYEQLYRSQFSCE